MCQLRFLFFLGIYGKIMIYICVFTSYRMYNNTDSLFVDFTSSLHIMFSVLVVIIRQRT